MSARTIKNSRKTAKPARRAKATANYEVSSGNVFADLGLPNPELELVKVKFALAIIARIQALALTQAQAAERMKIDQPRVSKIKCGRLGEFSLGTLFDLAVKIGIDFDIGMAQKAETKAAGRVNVHGDVVAA